MTKRPKPTAPVFDDDDEIELTAEQIAAAKPFTEALPEVAAAMKRSRGRPRVEQPKEKVTLRLSADVVAKLRASGPGWQTRLEETIRKGLGL